MIARAMWLKLLASAVVLWALYLGGTAIADRFRNKRYDADLAGVKVQDSLFKQDSAASVKTDIRSAHIDTVVSVIYVREQTAKRNAVLLSRIADTTGQAATNVRDSSLMWHSRYLLRTAERDTLLVALGAADARADSLGADRDSLRTDRNRWRIRAAALDSLNKRLAADLTTARSGGCHLIPFVPCPSRKVVAVVAAATGAVAWHNRRALGLPASHR